jgi:hypothetical protein
MQLKDNNMKNQDNYLIADLTSELTSAIDYYMMDHFQDHLKVLGLTPSGKFDMLISDAIDCTQLKQIDSDNVQINLPLSLAYRVLITPKIYQWANGISLIPTLHALFKQGTLDLLKNSALFLQDIAPRKNWGIVWGAFHLLGLQGWIRIEGRDENSQFFLTDFGVAIVTVINKNAEVFDRVCNAIHHLRHYHQYIYEQNIEPAVLNELHFLSELCLSNWHISSHCENHLRLRAEKQLISLLDGMLIAPLMVALGMPLYKRTTDGRITVEKTSFLSQFQHHVRQPYTVMAEGYQAKILSTAVDLLCTKGIFVKSADELLLTDWGKASLPIASPYSALAVSYLKSYQHIAELFIY